MVWDGTEAVLEAVKAALQTGMAAKLAAIDARHDDELALITPSPTDGYLVGLIGTGAELLKRELLGLADPGVVILAGEESPDPGYGSEGSDLSGRYDTLTDVLVFVRVRSTTLSESDRLLQRYAVAVTELLVTQNVLAPRECVWVGTAGTVTEMPDDEGYLQRTRGTAFRVRSYDQGA